LTRGFAADILLKYKEAGLKSVLTLAATLSGQQCLGVGCADFLCADGIYAVRFLYGGRFWAAGVEESVYNITEVLFIAKLEHQINDDIRDKQVRLVGEEGEQLGVVPLEEAQAAALAKGLDLVKIAPKAEPPVCKIMDYGKFRFEQAKKEKEARRNQKIVEIKEIRLSSKIDIHDFDVRLKNAHKFLLAGDKVKCSIRFRGREMAHTDIGLAVMKRFAEACIEVSTVEKPPKLEGRQMLMFLAPLKNKP